jgi:hypothetical protein
MHLRGAARLPDGQLTACGTCLIREDDGPDWLDFYLPLGALERVLPVGGYPFESGDHEYRQWQKQLDPWLADFGRRIFDAVPFRLGLIGFEVSGDTHRADLEAYGVPEQRNIGYLVPQDGQLRFFPATPSQHL